MHYRKLGNTGMEVSVIGLGGVQLGSSEPEYAVQVVRKALELGVNYFDTARSYWDSEIKMGMALKGEPCSGYGARQDSDVALPLTQGGVMQNEGHKIKTGSSVYIYH
jgi:predicted aldo/keto reductase-like oxidoreductase